MSALSQGHDSHMPSFQLEATTPLTPQSSHYSGGSPLSHVSMSASPEPPFFPVSSGGDQLDPSSSLPPHSIHHHMVTSNTSSTVTPSTSICSPVGLYQHTHHHHHPLSTELVLAQGHASGTSTISSDLDIVRSLELITGGTTGHISTSSAMTTSVDSSVYNSSSPCQPGHTPPPSAGSSCSTSPIHINSYDQYEFELLQLMSNPDDLLADPKMLLHPPSAAPTPIH